MTLMKKIRKFMPTIIIIFILFCTISLSFFSWHERENKKEMDEIYCINNKLAYMNHDFLDDDLFSCVDKDGSVRIFDRERVSYSPIIEDIKITFKEE